MTLNEPIVWDRLAPPPRRVPSSVRARVRVAELQKAINFRSGFLNLWLLAAGSMLILFGIVWFWGANPEDYPIVGVILAATGLAMLVFVGVHIYLRGARIIRLLRNGTHCRGIVTHVREVGLYEPYTSFVAKWQEFVDQSRAAGADWALSQTMSHARRFACKVRVADRTGTTHDIQTHLDLADLLATDVMQPQVELLCDAGRGRYGVILSQLDSALTISPNGQWTVRSSAHFLRFMASFVRSAVPVVGTYLMAAVGLIWFDSGITTEAMMNVGPLTGAGVVLLFTLSHVLLPVFLYSYYLDFISTFAKAANVGPARSPQLLVFCLRTLAVLFIGIWFVGPIVVLAWLTSWLPLVWAAVHLALARRGSRTWLFIEYGSTSMALLLFVACFSAERLFPLGLAIVVVQGLLLTLLDLKARERWIAHEAQPGPHIVP